MSIKNLTWDQFGVISQSKDDSFEDMCLFLLCRELKVNRFDSYINQIGIETEPINSNGVHYGFQSKFFTTGFKWEKIKESVNKALENYTELDVLYIYSNVERTKKGNKKTTSELELEQLARRNGVKLIYETNGSILRKLQIPKNLDLTQLYFGSGYEFGFIKNSCDVDIMSFLVSESFIPLPFIDSKDRKVNSIEKEIIKSNKPILIAGQPGSGKSIYMHRLIQKLGGLDKSSEEKMLDHIIKNNTIPSLINLKNCGNDSLESIIRGRKNDNLIKGTELKFTYILDGLDELSEQRSDIVLHQIFELTKNPSTKNVIISCRTGNLNRIKAKTYFTDLKEYFIDELTEEYVERYFNKKHNKNKKDQYHKLKKTNTVLISELKDILLIKLFWETVEDLNDSSDVLDLFDKKIEILINSQSHKKNIAELNLLNPKQEKIIQLNKDLSFEFQKRFQFRFKIGELQEIILERYDRLDYKSINEIIAYIADLFFDTNSKKVGHFNNSYIYQHRRYQEYFFIQKLKDEYEKDPKILRRLNVISNNELFEDFFLNYLENNYLEENDITGLADTNLIKFYLENQPSFGLNPSFNESFEGFFTSLATQEDILFDEIIANENISIQNSLRANLDYIKQKFQEWNRNKKNYELVRYLTSVWTSTIQKLIIEIHLLWKNERYEISKIALNNLEEIESLFKEYEFFKNLEQKDHIEDPYWNKLSEWIFIRMVIYDEPFIDLYESLAHKRYSSEINRLYGESPQRTLLKKLFEVAIINKKREVIDAISKFDRTTWLAFLDVLSSVEFVHIFIKTSELNAKVKAFVLKFSEEISEENFFMTFFKNYYDKSLTSEEIEYLEKREQEIINQKPYRWKYRNIDNEFILICGILGSRDFEKIFNKSSNYNYYHQPSLYAALYKEYILFLKGEESLYSIIGKLKRYDVSDNKNRTIDSYLTEQTSKIIAILFCRSNLDDQDLITLKNSLSFIEKGFSYYHFFQKLSDLDSRKFSKITNEGELKYVVEKNLKKDSDFSSKIEILFSISKMFAKISIDQARFYFMKGINDGLLRHVWRKDHIISDSLVQALDIMWRTSWLEKSELINYTEQVFELTYRAKEITDQKVTWRGPYNLVDTLAKYDILLAEEYKERIIEREEYQYWNGLILSLLLRKIELGMDIEEIERGMSEFRSSYSYSQGHERRETYENNFMVYLSISDCEFYTKEERKESFEKAYEEVETAKSLGIDYFLPENEYSEERKLYLHLCKKYGKECQLELGKKESNNLKEDVFDEQSFVDEINSATSYQKLYSLYRMINDYEKNIVLEDASSWEVLIRKTVSILSNIKPFISLLEKNNYPFWGYWSRNSSYFHYGVAECLRNPEVKGEMIRYLSKSLGHEGFLHMMLTYEVLNDSETCKKLFKRYVQLSKFLVE